MILLEQDEFVAQGHAEKFLKRIGHGGLNQVGSGFRARALMEDLGVGESYSYDRYTTARNRLFHEGELHAGSLEDRLEEMVFLRSLSTEVIFRLIGYHGPLHLTGHGLGGVVELGARERR